MRPGSTGNEAEVCLHLPNSSMCWAMLGALSTNNLVRLPDSSNRCENRLSLVSLLSCGLFSSSSFVRIHIRKDLAKSRVGHF